MAILQNEMLTLSDYHKRKDPKGGLAELHEAVVLQTAVLKDMPVYPSNREDAHEVHARTHLPSGEAWGRINKGVKPTKTDTDKWKEPIGFKEFMIALDARNNPAPGALMQMRAQELEGHSLSMGMAWERAILYHNIDENPDGIMGVLPRYTDPNGKLKRQIIEATPGATGNDFTSALVVNWGPKKVYGVFPPGFAKSAGLEHEDMGKQLWDDGEGGKFPAWVSVLRQWLGVVVHNYRAICRVQFKVSTLDSKDPLIRDNLIKAIHRVKRSGPGGRTVVYTNPILEEILDLQAANGMTHLTTKSYMGEEITHIRGIPLRSTEVLSTSEAALGS